MAERPVAGAETRRVPDRAFEVHPRPADRLLERLAARQTGRNRRRERAARAMGMGRVDARAADLEFAVARADDVDDLRSGLEMAALHDYDARAELADPAPCVAHVRDAADRPASQPFGLGHVGGHDLGQPEELR